MRTHVGDEFLEEIGRIVRARPGLGMVLDGEHWKVSMSQALKRSIVEIEMREFDIVLIDARGIYGKTVVV